MKIRLSADLLNWATDLLAEELKSIRPSVNFALGDTVRAYATVSADYQNNMGIPVGAAFLQIEADPEELAELVQHTPQVRFEGTTGIAFEVRVSREQS